MTKYTLSVVFAEKILHLESKFDSISAANSAANIIMFAEPRAITVTIGRIDE